MNKFEQLLDYIVNEEKEKAEELFHAIVVEKSRDIYENLISEEETEDEEAEAKTEEDEVEEAVEEAFGMEDEAEAEPEMGGDATDDLAGDTEDPMAMGDEEGGEEGGDETPATKGDVQDLEDALEDLKAEFEKLMAGDSGEESGEEDEFGGEEEPADEFGDEEGGDEEGGDEEGENPFAETRQMTREYRETVAKPSNTGGESSNKSVALQNPKGRPTTTASAHNLLGGKGGEAGIKGGEGLVGGVKGKFTSANTHNVDNVKSGVKTLSKVTAGHGAEKKGAGEGAVNDRSPADRRQ